MSRNSIYLLFASSLSHIFYCWIRFYGDNAEEVDSSGGAWAIRMRFVLICKSTSEVYINMLISMVSIQ